MIWTWPLPAPPPPPFAGFAAGQPTDAIVGVLPAGGTFDLPGPATGTHRIYSQFNVFPATGAPIAAPGVSGSFNGLQLTFSGQTATFPNAIAPNSVILAAGEFLRLANGSANPGDVYAPYFDLNAPTWTVVRVPVLAALTTLIPAPTRGFRTIVGARGGSSGGRAVLNRWVAYNADTVAHNVACFLNGSLISRNTTTINAGLTNIVGPVDPVITAASGPLQARTLEAIVTTPPLVSFTYEDFS